MILLRMTIAACLMIALFALAAEIMSGDVGRVAHAAWRGIGPQHVALTCGPVPMEPRLAWTGTRT